MTTLFKEGKGERNVRQGSAEKGGQRETHEKSGSSPKKGTRWHGTWDWTGQDGVGWGDRERRGVTGQDGMGQDRVG